MKQSIKSILIFLCFSFITFGWNTLLCFDLDSALQETTQLLQNQESENDTIIEKLHQKGITIFTTRNSFMPDNQIRRDEAAKMLTITKQILKNRYSLPWENPTCEFNDLHEAWEDLKDIIKTSCSEGLFHGHQGNFMPKKSITNGELLTVIGRILYGTLDENEGHFAKNYAENLNNENLLKDTNLMDSSKRDSPATRWTLAIVIGNILN